MHQQLTDYTLERELIGYMIFNNTIYTDNQDLILNDIIINPIHKQAIDYFQSYSLDKQITLDAINHDIPGLNLMPQEVIKPHVIKLGNIINSLSRLKRSRVIYSMIDGFVHYELPKSNLDTSLLKLMDDISKVVDDSEMSKLPIITNKDIIKIMVDIFEKPKAYMPTYFDKVDRLLGGGATRNNLVVVAGYPGSGKTFIALNWYLNTIKHKHMSVFFTIEMSKEQITERIANVITNKKLTPQNISHADFDEMYLHVNECSHHIVEDRNLSVSKIRRYLVDLKSKGYQLDYIFVDYLGIMQKNPNRQPMHAIGDITVALKTIAHEFDCVVVLVCQINRTAGENKNKRPSLQNLSGSSSVENDADMVLSGYREEYFLIQKNEAVPSELLNVMEIGILKNRHGGGGTSINHFDGFSGKITGLDQGSTNAYLNEIRGDKR